MSWEHPHILLGLWLLPLVAGLLAYAQRKRAAAARRLLDPTMLGRLMPGPAGWCPWVKSTALLLGLACLTVAGARPRFGVFVERVSQRGADLMVLLDVSRSMTAEDVPPSRLERAKSDVRDLLARVAGDRVGLVVFAGKPVLKVPLTTDQGFFRMMLDEVGPHSAPRGGTLIGDGIRKCLQALPQRRDRDQAIVLITDGEDHDSYPEEAAKQAGARGIKIFAVGLGDPREGSRIPQRDAARRLHYLKYQGQEVWSKLDERLLERIALVTGGAYIPAGTRVYDLGRIYTDHLAKLTRGLIHAEKRRRYREQFQLFVALGLGLLLAEMLLPGYPRPSALSGLRVASSARQAPSGLAVVGSALGLVLVSAASPSALAGPRDAAAKVRQGIAQFHQGDYRTAAAAFQEAEQAQPENPRIVFDRACALAAAGETELAIEGFRRASLAPGEPIAVQSRYNLGNVAAAKARAVFGKDPESASPETRQQGLALLAQAVAHYRDCLGLDPDHADARHNLELIRLWIKHMEALWRQRDRQKQRDAMNLLEMLAMLESRQRELRSDSDALADEPDSPKRRHALAQQAAGQRELADEIAPLKKKLEAAFRSGDSHGHRDALMQSADRTQTAMTTAAGRLDAGRPDHAAQAQTEALENLNQIYQAVVPFVPMLQRALMAQQRLADQVDQVVQGKTLTRECDCRDVAWEQGLVAGWSALLPSKAAQELKQWEAAPPLAPSGQTPQGPDAAQEAQHQCECLKRAMRKAIELGPDALRMPAAEAAALLDGRKLAEALAKQNESLKRLREIADLLPPAKKSQPNAQADKKAVTRKQDKQPKEQRQAQAARKPQQAKKEDFSKQRAEAVLRTVRQRQQQRREWERQLQQRYLAPSGAVEKDW